MPLSDYFSAPSDESAARVVEPDVHLGDPPYDVLWMKNLMPDYHLVPVEAFLTDRSEKEVKENPRNGMVLANVEDTVVVVTVSDELTASLAESTSDQLAKAAESWSNFADFQGTDTSGLAGFLGNLADLARRATARRERLYCHLCI